MAKKYPSDEFKKQLTSPFGTLKYPKLDEVDYGTEEYPDPDGSFNTRVILDRDADGVAEFLAELDTMMGHAGRLKDEAIDRMPPAKRKKAENNLRAFAPYEDVLDEETGDETGEVEFRVKMKASGIRKTGAKWHSKPTLIDGCAQKIPAGVNIWGGSKGRVTFMAIPDYWAGTDGYGVQRKLLGVQITELVQGGERSADSLGFGAIDGGFSADSLEQSAPQGDSEDPGAGVDDVSGNF